MEPDEIRRGVLDDLRILAPEIDPALLSPHRPLRRQVDLDSMDWLRLLVRWHERFGIDIPEAEDARLRTLDAVVAYVAERLAAAGRPGPG
jgi:acyl carrier protein